MSGLPPFLSGAGKSMRAPSAEAARAGPAGLRLSASTARPVLRDIRMLRMLIVVSLLGNAA